MKWFCALNESSMRGDPDYWQPMLLAAVASAAARTDLQPHLIWDGALDHPFLDVLRQRGVTVVPHRVSFYVALEQYAPQNPDPRYLEIASGAFLRTELPLLCDDEVVLYTDVDVLFTGSFDLTGSVPRLFSCAGEFKQDDPNDFNTGVMLMNLPALRTSLPSFTTFITANLDRFPTFDQAAYRLFYAGRVDVLPNTYNWKPYWGRNDDARIVHFHGPKPRWARFVLAHEDNGAVPIFTDLFTTDVPAYTHYVDRWTQTARAAGASF